MAAVSDWYQNFYHNYLEKTDPRTDSWPLTNSPTTLLVIIVSYLFFVLKFGPDYMKHRKPYNLKTIITAYNMAQIAACSYLFYGILNSGWLDEFSLGCQPVNYSMTGTPYRLSALMWWTLMLKVLELLETVFFVLRKKQTQISPLHLYHHVSTLTVGWLCTRYTAGGMGSFSILPNCLIHVLMYTYYLIALQGGREVQKKLIMWKKTLTVLQMVQFCAIIIHSISGLLPSCDFNKLVSFTFVPNIFFLFYLFYDFYQTAYKTKQK